MKYTKPQCFGKTKCMDENPDASQCNNCKRWQRILTEKYNYRKNIIKKIKSKSKWDSI